MSDFTKPPLHGRDHLPGGSDPIPGIGPGAVTNDWVLATTPLGTVSSGVGEVQAGFSYISYQTDNGSVFAVNTGGAYDTISMLQVGSYLVRVGVDFPEGRTGTILVAGVIGGPVTTTDYDTAAGTPQFTDIAPGQAWWEQLCVVNNLSAPAGVFMSFQQATGSNMVGVLGSVQIFRLT